MLVHAYLVAGGGISWVAVRKPFEEGQAAPLTVACGDHVLIENQRLQPRVGAMEVVSFRTRGTSSVFLNHPVEIEAARFEDAQYRLDLFPKIRREDALVFVCLPATGG